MRVADVGDAGGPSDGPAVRVETLSRTFGDRRVLCDVSFDVTRGAVHALLGGNGSGKSTLVKALSGVQSGDPGGRITIGTSTVESHHATPTWAAHAGLRVVHQDPATFPTLSVAENLFVAHGMPARAGWVDRRTLLAQSRALLDRFQIDVSPTDEVGTLRLADRTMVAIARALRPRAAHDHPLSVLVLDEPTAALPEEEVGVLLDAVRRTAASGVSILYISHRLEEVLAVADEVTVLRDGVRVTTGPLAGVTERQLVSWIVGRPLDNVFPSPAADTAPGREVLAVRHACGGPLRGVDMQAHAGEIVGIAGLLGSGGSELLRAVFGARRLDSGSVVVDGDPTPPRTPAEAMDRGVAYVSENRETESAFPDLPVRTNICAADRGRHSRWGVVQRRAERADVRRSMIDYAVRGPGDEAPMSSLSGGNQQKVVLARWMRREPALLLLDEPTQGVDIGARADIYHLVRSAVDDGVAVVLVSSDLEELAEMADRVLVLRDGVVAAEVSGADLTRHRLAELVLSSGEEDDRDVD